MVKAIAASIVIVGLVSSVTFGDIVNEQTWILTAGDIGAPNTIALSGAAGGASLLTGIGTLETQTGSNATDGTTASQGFGTGLLQNGQATNFGASTIGIAQAATSAGANLGAIGATGQVQDIGGGLLTQAEGVSLLAAQGLSKTGGAGMANASNGLGLGMGQSAADATLGATFGQTSVIVGVQTSQIGGGNGATVATTSSMTGSVVQAQQID